MIFLSHNHKDKEIVEPIALKLAELIGKENIFYDSWSIQPGEGIIDKMNQGLEKMQYFFFFVSRNSLESNMVKLEWQNALFKASCGKCRFIPIKLDDCIMPSILLQNLYIDFYNNGIDVGLSQLVDVIQGNNVFSPIYSCFQNVVCYCEQINDYEMICEFSATRFVEPISRYLILFKEDPDDIEFKLLTDSVFQGGPINNVTLQNGTVWNGYSVGLSRSTTPKLPVRIKISKKSKTSFGPLMPMHFDTEDSYKQIKFIKKV